MATSDCKGFGWSGTKIVRGTVVSQKSRHARMQFCSSLRKWHWGQWWIGGGLIATDVRAACMVSIPFTTRMYVWRPICSMSSFEIRRSCFRATCRSIRLETAGKIHCRRSYRKLSWRRWAGVSASSGFKESNAWIAHSTPASIIKRCEMARILSNAALQGWAELHGLCNWLNHESNTPKNNLLLIEPVNKMRELPSRNMRNLNRMSWCTIKREIRRIWENCIQRNCMLAQAGNINGIYVPALDLKQWVKEMKQHEWILTSIETPLGTTVWSSGCRTHSIGCCSGHGSWEGGGVFWFIIQRLVDRWGRMAKPTRSASQRSTTVGFMTGK